MSSILDQIKNALFYKADNKEELGLIENIEDKLIDMS